MFLCSTGRADSVLLARRRNCREVCLGPTARLQPPLLLLLRPCQRTSAAQADCGVRTQPRQRRWCGPRASAEQVAANGGAPSATSAVPAPSTPTDAAELSRRSALPAAVLDAEAIERVLPHRYPFLLVDKVLECAAEQRIVAVKNVTYNEQFFEGHFPSAKIMPGVLQLEALAQCCGLMLLSGPDSEPGRLFLFASVENLRWRRPVRPGDVLVMECQVMALRKRFGIAKCRGRGYVDGELAVEADMTFACNK